MTKKPQMVCVDWIDAALTGTNQVSRKEAEEAGLVHGFAVGVLVSEDKNKVVLAMDWFDEHDEFRTISVYPKSGIKEIRRFNIFERKQNDKSNQTTDMGRTV